METLNAVGLTRLSVLPKRTEHRRAVFRSAVSNLKNQTLSRRFKNSLDASAVARSLHGGLVLLSSLLGSGLARALTYEEALEQPLNAPVSDFDFTGVESVATFAAENPVIVGGGVAVLAVPILVSQLLGKPKTWGFESARNAYAKLGDDTNAQLLDIRAQGDGRQFGSPDISGFKKKPVAVAYKKEDKPGFLKKLASKFKEPESTTLFILDKFDENSELVAELVTANGFKAAYAIRDGAEGSRGWKNSGLPWQLPSKGLSFDLRSLSSSFELQETTEAVPLALGVAAAAGLGILAFTEVEVILQLLGSAALIQFASKKLLFAEDRKQTVQQFEEFLNTKVAPKELVGDIQKIGKSLLPSPATSKALPAPPDAASAPSDGAALKFETPDETNSAPPPPQVNSVPKEAVQKEIAPGLRQSLSPYPNYPDYKPPSSPIPSQP